MRRSSESAAGVDRNVLVAQMERRSDVTSGASKDGNAEEKQSTALTKSSCDTDEIRHDTPEWLGVDQSGIANLVRPPRWGGREGNRRQMKRRGRKKNKI